MIPFTFLAWLPNEELSWAACWSFSCWSSFSNERYFSWTVLIFSTKLLPSLLSACATREIRSDCSWTLSIAVAPVIASIRRIPAAVPDSLIMRNRPISPVLAAWVPPQSSVEKSPMVKTRTRSSYFSPKSAIAPFCFASSRSINSVTTGELRRICALTMSSISRNCSGFTASKWEKSKRRYLSLTKEPFWVTWVPNTWRNAACNKCVAEWFKRIASRRATSMTALILWLTIKDPEMTLPIWPIALPYFCVSVTSNWLSLPIRRPLSPTWPPDSA